VAAVIGDCLGLERFASRGFKRRSGLAIFVFAAAASSDTVAC